MLIETVHHSALPGLLLDTHTQYLLANGLRAMTGNLNMGTKSITNIDTVTASGVITTPELLMNLAETEQYKFRLDPAANVFLALTNENAGGGATVLRLYPPEATKSSVIQLISNAVLGTSPNAIRLTISQDQAGAAIGTSKLGSGVATKLVLGANSNSNLTLNTDGTINTLSDLTVGDALDVVGSTQLAELAVGSEAVFNSSVNLSALTGPAGLYITAEEFITTTAPTSGILGHWKRTGTLIETANAGDNVTLGGDLTVTALTTSLQYRSTDAVITNGIVAFGNEFTEATGIGSLAIGNGIDGANKTLASGENSVAMSVDAKATALQSICIGAGSTSSGVNSVVIGASANASGSTRATALGAVANATASDTTQIGWGTNNVIESTSFGSRGVNYMWLKRRDSRLEIGGGLEGGSDLGGGNVTEDWVLRFKGFVNNGDLTWFDDEDYFLFSDAVHIGNGTDESVFSATGSITQAGLATATLLQLQVINNVGFYGTTPVTQNQLQTGAGATVDDVITQLQRLGLVKQAA